MSDRERLLDEFVSIDPLAAVNSRKAKAELSGDWKNSSSNGKQFLKWLAPGLLAARQLEKALS